MADYPSGKGALRPRARLLRTLGNDLISSDKVAIIELVKNAYDADASTVLIRFRGPLSLGAGQIEVWDDGHGMDLQTLQTAWLDIATDSKKRSPHSESGRRVLGEKGIGRLAAARIGSDLLLVTRRSNSNEVKLLIDWTQFDKDDAYLDEIEVGWEVGEADFFDTDGAAMQAFTSSSLRPMNLGRGTVLQMNTLMKQWSRRDLEELRTALTRLIRPRPSVDSQISSGFEIHVSLSDVDEELMDLGGQIGASEELQTPHYRLTGTVDADGVATLQYQQMYPPAEEHLGTRSLWDDNSKPPAAGPIEFELNVWDRDNEAIQRTLSTSRGAGEYPSTREMKGFRSELDQVAGVSVYRDGFRVLPFGERGDDWLGLDLRRVQSPTRRLSNNQIIGHIFIGADTNDALRDQSNREGFLEGAAYADLQAIMRSALTILENKRYGARREGKPDPRPRGGLFKRFDLDEIGEAITSEYPGDKRLIGLVGEKNREIQDGVAEMQRVLSRYSKLATLGSLVDRVLHDGRTAVSRILSISRFAQRDLAKLTLKEGEKLRIAGDAMDTTATQAGVLSALFKQIEPFGGRKRGRPPEVSVRSLVEDTLSILHAEAEEKGIVLKNISQDFAVRLDESEVLTVLINLVQNAIYWTARFPSIPQPEVLVGSRTNEDGSVTFSVIDTGPGVPHDLRNLIFDPYFSSKPEGVGLGLSIAGTIVEEIYEGELALVESHDAQGANFEATFRKRV